MIKSNRKSTDTYRKMYKYKGDRLTLTASAGNKKITSRN